jgi:hypothetical protein
MKIITALRLSALLGIVRACAALTNATEKQERCFSQLCNFAQFAGTNVVQKGLTTFLIALEATNRDRQEVLMPNGHS